MDPVTRIVDGPSCMGLQGVVRLSASLRVRGGTDVVVHLSTPALDGLVVPHVEVLSTFHGLQANPAAELHAADMKLALFKVNRRRWLKVHHGPRETPTPTPLFPVETLIDAPPVRMDA